MNIKKFLPILSVVAIFLWFASSCEDETEIAGQEVPSSEILLHNPLCSWSEMKTNQLYKINSSQGLTNLLSCEDGIPEFNFDDNTLLIVSGKTSYNITEIKKHLAKISHERYILTIEVSLDGETGGDTDNKNWILSLQTPKIPNSATVELVINYIS